MHSPSQERMLILQRSLRMVWHVRLSDEEEALTFCEACSRFMQDGVGGP